MTDTEIVEPKRVEEILLSHLTEKGVLLENPQAWTIGYSDLGGRGMFATRNIEPGELIYVDAPLIIGPRCSSKYLPMCACCYKNDCPLFPCDRGCGLPICSVECEKSPMHTDYECQYLRSLEPTCGSDWSLDLLLAIVPIRAVFMTERQRECLAALQWHRTVSHGQEIKLLRRSVANSPSEEDVQLMERVCGTFNTNSFETVSVHDKHHSTSLRGLYPMGGLQNHCCTPNTRHHFDGQSRMHVSATLPVSKGEELTMTYTSLFWDTTLRRPFLSATKHFSCNCKRCSDPTEFGSKLGAIFCASDDCDGNLLPQNPLNPEIPWICDKCEKKVNSRQIRSIRSGLAAIVEEILYKTPRQIYKFIRKELSALVPSHNYLMMSMKFRIISYFGRTEGLTWADLTDAELDVKWTYCNELLYVLDILQCGECKKKGLILYELYCTNIEKIRRLKQQQDTNKDFSCISLTINDAENEQLLEKAMSILQDDSLTVTMLEDDKKTLIKYC